MSRVGNNYARLEFDTIGVHEISNAVLQGSDRGNNQFTIFYESEDDANFDVLYKIAGSDDVESEPYHKPDGQTSLNGNNPLLNLPPISALAIEINSLGSANGASIVVYFNTFEDS